jgi:hypothetical protein
MARRQQRLDAFVHEGEPPADRPVELLCEDHVGTYVVPFPCQWSSGDWTNVKTGERIDATVIGWRARVDARGEQASSSSQQHPTTGKGSDTGS